MLPRHSDQLMNRLERIADIGVAEIRRSEFMLWFGQDRLTTSIWRETNDKWKEVLASDRYTDSEISEIPLFVAEADGTFVLIWGSNLDLNEEKQGEPFFYPISAWMTIKERKPRVASEVISVEYGTYTIKKDENGSIVVEDAGDVVSPTRPVLQKIAKKLGVSITNSKDNPLNTRQLGSDLIAAIKLQH